MSLIRAIFAFGNEREMANLVIVFPECLRFRRRRKAQGNAAAETLHKQEFFDIFAYWFHLQNSELLSHRHARPPRRGSPPPPRQGQIHIRPHLPRLYPDIHWRSSSLDPHHRHRQEPHPPPAETVRYFWKLRGLYNASLLALSSAC